MRPTLGKLAPASGIHLDSEISRERGHILGARVIPWVTAMESPSESRPDLDALLGEADWVLRIARSLVRDEHAALDLSQDVLGDALAAPSPLRGARLRAWLWTIAKRRASRQILRERSRPAVEAEAATPETNQSGADFDRIELHVDLAREIQGLDEEDRRVLVGFFLEGQCQRELARMEGCSPATLRKRVARAKARLRTRLNSSPRGRDGWTAGLFVLAFPDAAPAVAGTSGSAASSALEAAPLPSTSLLPLFAMKLALLSITAAALVFVAVRVLAPGNENPIVFSLGLAAIDASPDSRVERETPETAALEMVAPDDRLAGSVVTIENEVAAEALNARSIRIVDESQSPLVDGRAVWLGSDGVPLDAPVDDAGVATIHDSRDGRLFVAAPGYLGRMVPLAEAEGVSLVQPMTVVLGPPHVLEGRVTVDGVAPGRSLYFRHWQLDGDMHLGERLDPNESVMRKLLGLEPATSSWLRTDENGHFRFELAWEWTTARFRLPRQFVVSSHEAGALAGPGAGFVFALDGSQHQVDLIQLPAVSGRLVWSEDASGVTGLLGVYFEDSDGSSSMTHEFLNPDGRFSIAPMAGSHSFDPAELDLDRMEVAGEPIEVSQALRLVLDGQRIDLGSVWDRGVLGLPVDLGDIEVLRPSKLKVRVMSRSSQQTIDASVVGSGRSRRTGADGEAEVTVAVGTPLRVLAMGFGLYTTEVTQAQIDQGQTLTVELDPAPVLAVKVPADAIPASEQAPLVVRLEFERTPFSTAQLDENDCGNPYDFGLHRSLQGANFVGGGWSHSEPGAPGDVDYELPISGELRIGGLIEGRSIRLLCLQGKAVLFERELKIAPGETVIEPRL